jgi:hypothetical protein
MKVKITLVKIKIECLVCRFFLGLPQRTTYTVARKGFSDEMKLCLNLNEVGNILGLEISTITKLYENIFI